MNYYDSFLGADSEGGTVQSLQEASAEGLYEGIKDSVKYLFLGSVVLVVAAIALKEKHIIKLRKRILE